MLNLRYSFADDTPSQSVGEGATLIYLMLQDRPGVFAAIAATLSRLNLSIVDASIHTSTSGQCFNALTVLTDGEALASQSEFDIAYALSWAIRWAVQP